MAYLITCAGSKRKELSGIQSSIEAISFHKELIKSREKLIIAIGLQLDWQNCLPAWKLYSGTYSKLYPKISAENWIKACADVKILSALFGWISPCDLVPYYDVKMTDAMRNNEKVSQFWHSSGVLKAFVHSDDIDLLSGSYRKAVSGNSNPIAITPKIIFKDKYGSHKGIWLNEQLTKIKS
jgi:cytoplasmic iron level regulating protein YaaA (DUF328/UPF0246 family)